MKKRYATRVEREKHTIALMIRIWCRRKHAARQDDLCEDCRRLLTYAHTRLDHCPHGELKPSCKRCAIHCYRPEMREEIRNVMRYVGPRMIYLAPREAFLHLFR